MKYIVLLGDGMADAPVAHLGGSTPLEAARKPHMDELAQLGEMGLVQTVPKGMAPGSDVANLSVMGYDPYIYYTGRSPLEAASIGVELLDDDMAFRVNLVTLSDEADYAQKTMIDYSADEISTEEAKELILAVGNALGTEQLQFHSGISYRHLLVWHGLQDMLKLTPPHDISGKPIAQHLPSNSVLLDLMEKSSTVLENHPVNVERVKRGLRPANSIWIWGQGKKPALTSFEQKHGLKGAVISAVDLIKGIGLCAGMQSIDVEGATGTIHTNFRGKAQAALDALLEVDFVYLHMEAPDECGHRFEVENKVRSIELIDEQVVGPIVEEMTRRGEPFSILLLPDHPTPLAIGTHTGDPVPYVLFRSTQTEGSGLGYTEQNAQKGPFVESGQALMEQFLKER